ncbi:archaemetzincin family Zn-dependent metalloprotease [Thermodesulfobacteriota bacterium]
MRPIGVVSFGEVTEIVLKAIAANILGYLHIDTDIASPLEYPNYAYDKGRLQYNAGTILSAFESIPFHDYEKVIGVLDVDLFVPILTYVFGEARQGGKCALVSLHRLKRNLDGSTSSRSLLLERAAKVALHELGHLFNLIHCEDERCLMHFSGGIKDLDKTPPYFCRYCSVYLRDALSIDKKIYPNTLGENDF